MSLGEGSELDRLINEVAGELGILRGHLRRIAEFGKLEEFETRRSEKDYKDVYLERALIQIRRLDGRATAYLNKIERRAYLKNIGRRTFPAGSSRAALGRK